MQFFAKDMSFSEVDDVYDDLHIAICALVHATEYTLATVERMQMLKTATKRELERQISISEVLIDQLILIGVEEPVDINGRLAIRVREKLDAKK